MSAAIHTERLKLISMTPAFLRASINHDRVEAERQLRISLPHHWPGELREILALRLEQLEDDPALQPWLLRAMVLHETDFVIGHIGFHTAPGADYLRPWAPGGVEFGFGVISDYRRKGYAREAARALMDWAHRTHGVARFVLTIRPDNIPSQRLASQLGFVRIGSHIDEVDGLEDILERKVATDRRQT